MVYKDRFDVHGEKDKTAANILHDLTHENKFGIVKLAQINFYFV